MKTNRYGQSAVLDSNQLDTLISALQGRHHQVLAEVCRRTACRISEGRQLTWASITSSGITFPKTICKGKLASRSVPTTIRLHEVLTSWRREWAALYGREPKPGDHVFPGRWGAEPMSSRAFMDALERAARETGLEGVSSHSFRRSALSSASEAGVPLAALRALSGHQSLSTLQRYLEISQSAKEQAAAAFA
jgi:integrase/recombinase XerD